MKTGGLDAAIMERTSPAPLPSAPRILALIETGQNFEPAGYALRVLLEIAGACVEVRTSPTFGEPAPAGFDAVVSYGAAPPEISGAPHVHLNACGLFSPDRYLKRASLPTERWEEEGLIALYKGQAGGEPALRRSESGAVVFNLDIVASAFVLLTCYPETITSGTLDKRGRRVAEESIPVRLETLDRPVVNEYSTFLRALLQDQNPRLEFPRRQWGGAEYAMAVTRDIDTLRKNNPVSARYLVGLTARGNMSGAARSLRGGLNARLRPDQDPHRNIQAITRWESSIGIKSSLYFMASDLIGDSNYRIEEAAARLGLEDLHARGWEIGFHPGYRTYASREAFESEKARLSSAVPAPLAGGRQHGLRFIPPFTWRHWEDSGFRYDSTLGYAEREGFRCGICLPFRPFDILENRVMTLWEIPLTVMDCSLDSYRGLDAGRSGEVMRRLRDQVKKHQGVFVLLWHNNYFGRENAGALHDELAGFVRDAVTEGAMVGPARDILDAWEARPGV